MDIIASCSYDLVLLDELTFEVEDLQLEGRSLGRGESYSGHALNRIGADAGPGQLSVHGEFNIDDLGAAGAAMGGGSSAGGGGILKDLIDFLEGNVADGGGFGGGLR